MLKRFHPLLSGAMLACACLLGQAHAQSRSATLDDVLEMRAFGSSSLSPDGRWAAYERQGPYVDSPRFDRDWRSPWATSDILLADLKGDATPERLLPAEPGAGFLIGPWSPNSQRLVIYRLSGDRFEAGVVLVAERRVRWLGLTPDLPLTGTGAAWINDRQLALTIRPDHSMPWQLRFQTTGRELMAERWRRTAEGRAPSRLILETDKAAVNAVAPRLAQQLVVVDVAQGSVRPLLTRTMRDMQPSPDGRAIAVLTEDEVTPLRPEERTVQSAVLRRSRLLLVATETGRITEPHETLDIGPHLLRWSDGSGAVLVWARRDPQTWHEGRLTLVSRSGAVTSLVTAGLEPWEAGRTVDDLSPVRADFVRGRVLMYARQTGSERFDWWRVDEGAPVITTRALAVVPSRLAAVHRGGALLIGDGALWEQSANGGFIRLTDPARQLSAAEPEDLLQTVRSRSNGAPRRSWAPAFEGGTLIGLDGDGSALWRSRAPACKGESYVRAVAQTSSLATCVEEGVIDLRADTPLGSRILDRLNPQFSELRLVKSQAIPHLDRLGRAATSYLHLPPDTRPSDIKGVLVHFYPGGGDSGRWRDPMSLRAGLRPTLLALGGYAVLSVGSAWETESRREDMFDDFAAGLDLSLEAAKTAHPDLPWDQLALYGHSFGGYASLGVASRTGRFKAVIASSAPSNMFSQWAGPMSTSRLWPEEWTTFNQTIGATEEGQIDLGAPPWETVDAYAAASPFLLVDRITTPVLLITGDRDYVAMAQSENMFAALHRLGRKARLVIYWGEGHGNNSPANIRDAYDQVFDWLDENLVGGSPSQAGGPGAKPAFNGDGDQDVGVAAAPDQTVPSKSVFHPVAVDQPQGR